MICFYCKEETIPSIYYDIFTCDPCDVEYMYLQHSNHINIYIDSKNFIQMSLPPYVPRTYFISNGMIPLILDTYANITPGNIKDKMKLYLMFL